MHKWNRRSFLQNSIQLSTFFALSDGLSTYNQIEAEPGSIGLYGADKLNSGKYQTDSIRQPAGIVWEYDASASVNSAPVIINNQIFVGTDDHKLHVVDIESGEGEVAYDSELEADESHLSATPAVLDGTVYVPFISNAGNPVKPVSELVALDIDTFETEWTFEPEDGISPSIVPEDSSVYVGANSELYALNIATGETRWSTDTADNGGSISTVPAVTDNAVIAPGLTGPATVASVSRGSGEVEWVFEDANSNIKQSPAVDSNTIYVGSADNHLYAIDRTNGNKEWEFETDGWVASPSVSDGNVYVGTRGNTLYAIDADTGKEQWTHQFDNWVTGKPAIVEDVVYAGSWDRTVVALSTDSGDKLWELELGGNLRVGVVPAGNRLYAPCHNGVLYSLAAGADRPQPSTESDGTSGMSITDNKFAEQPPVFGGIAAFTTALAGYGVWRMRSSDDEKPASDTAEDDSVTPSPADTRSRGGGSQASNTSSDLTDLYTLNGSPDEIIETPRLSFSYNDLTIQDQIGAGGNADVYHATVSSGSETIDIAVKEPRFSGTVHSEDVKRFLKEAKTWASLDDHDHIVSIVDYGSEPLPWIAMEYMNGGDLDNRVNDFSMAQAVWTAHAITRGVRHAHRQGVAHLDLKPKNILFQTVDGAWDIPKIGDWGFSKRLINTTHTLDGLSPHYAAPEQFDEEFGQTDEQTDIYQLGAVCYKLFTGEPPFTGTTTNVMQKTLTERPIPPSEVNTALPSGLDEVVSKALAKEKTDRYESVLYLRDDLGEFIETDNQIGNLSLKSSSPTVSDSPVFTAPSTGSTSGTTHSLHSKITGDEGSQPNKTSSGLSYNDIKIGESISRNDNSTVYKGHAITDGETHRLALKEPHLDETVSTGVIERFVHEATRWEKLSANESIVDVLGWGTKPAPWIAIEYMDKGHLGTLVDEISPRETVAVVSRLSEIIYYAHTRGIAHLDLKPTNVLLTSNSDGISLKISDWGIGNLSLHHSQSADGLDLAYTAPEQIDENKGDPGLATDVYALGAICYKLLTGNEPFSGTPAEIMRSTLAGEFRAASAVDTSLPDEVDTILEAAMSPEPSNRYESVLYFRDALQELG